MLRNKSKREKTDGIKAASVNRSIAQQRRSLRNAVQLWSLEHLENRRLLTAVVTTDQPDYAPGSTALFTATTDGGPTGNFQAGETIHFHIDRTDGIAIQAPPAVTDFNVIDGSTAAPYQDANGMWWYPDVDGQVNGAVQANWYVDPQFAGASLSLAGTGLTSGATAQTTFTDGPYGTLAVGAQSGSLNSGTAGNATFAIALGGKTGGNSVTVALSATGLPTGATASFSPNNFSSSSATAASTLTITTTSATPGGAFSFTVTDATSGLSNTGTLNVNNPAPTLASIGIPSGTRNQTLDVPLVGTNFTNGTTTASFGPNITLNSVTVTDSSHLTANITIGSGATTGARNVSVTNPAPGGGTATLTNAFTVNAFAAASAYRITAASTTPTAGANDQLTLTLVDQFGNTVTSFSGDKTLSFFGLSTSAAGNAPTVTDKSGAPIVDGNPELITFTNGVSSAGGILVAKKAETATLTVTDGTLTAGGTGGATLNLTVSAAAASQLAFTSATNSSTAGVNSAGITVTLEDQFGNLATRAGSVIVTPTSSSGGANKAFKTTGGATQATYTIAAGTSSVSFLYYDELAGTYNISTTNNAASPTLTNPTALSFSVSAAAASRLSFNQQPTSTTAGLAISPAPTVRIVDTFGNLTSSAASVTVALSSNSFAAGSTTSVNAVAGVATFSNLQINTAASNYTISASAGGLVGVTSGTFNVTAAAASHFSISTPASAAEGSPFSVTVTALDAFNNTTTGYTGKIHFTSTDAQASLPADYTFVAGDNGVHTFSNLVTLKTVASQTVTATDTATGSINGTSSSVTVTNVAPTVTAASNQNATEGASASISLGSFTDPGTDGPWSVDVNWGDGTTHTTFTSAAIGTLGSQAHTYGEEGAQTVTVKVTDTNGGSGSATFTVTAADASLAAGVLTPPVVSEGVAFSNTTVFHFTDADPAAAAADYSALVTRGDGTSVTLTSTLSANGQIVANGGGFDVQLSYTYAEELSGQTFGVSVTDHSATTSQTISTFSVADQQLTTLASANLPASGQEGAALAAISGIATFTDPAGAEAVSDYTATINWGDSTTSPGTVVHTSGNNFRVDAPTHTYTEEGTYSVNVTLKHDALATVTTPTQSISVADAALSSTAANLTPPVATEATAFTNTTVFHFTDADALGTASDYVATVQTGDATLTSAVNPTNVTIVANGGGFDVKLSYTYAEELSNQTFAVSVTDHNATTSQSTSTFSVADQQLTGLATAAMPTGKLEGTGIGLITGIATFTDPAGPEAVGDYTATINWGDTTTSTGTVVQTSGNNFRVDAPSHTYAEEGTYTVNVTLTHDLLGTLTTPNQSITIADQQLTSLASANLPASGQEGAALAAITGLVTFTDPAGAGVEPLGDFTATVNWGDTTTSTGTVVSLGGGNYRVDAPAHTYAEEGTFTVNVTVKHDLLGTLTTPNQSISIADAALTAGTLTQPVATEGAAFSNVTVFHFTDADPAAAASDYSALVTLGDGTSVTLTSSASANGQIVANGGGFDVQVSHTYLEELTGQTFGVLVTDHSATASASTTTFSVADAGVSAGALIPPVATEGAAFNNAVVFHFTDADSAALASDYVATVQTGDAMLTSAANPTNVQVVAQGNHFDVVLSYTYAEELTNKTFSVSVSDAGGASASASTNSFSVSDAALTAGALTPPVATEGSPFSNVTVFHFSDADPNGAASDYSALVTRGDGTSVTLTSTAGANGQIVPHTGGGFDVQMSYTYAEELSGQTFSVVVTDHASTASASTSTFGVIDPAVTVNANSGGTLTAINEATSTAANTVVGTFTDSGNPTGTLDSDQTSIKPEYKVVIAWGDGNTTTLDSFNNASAFVSTGSGTFQVKAPAHTYAEEGSYNVSLTVTHDALSAVGPAQTATITVADPAVSVTGVAVSATEGLAFTGASVATFTDPAGAEAADGTHYSASINWGDGTAASTGTINLSGGTFTVKGDHTYGEEGSFTVTTTVNHEGVITAATSTATVADAALTAGALTPPLATEGAAFSNVTVFHFSDADPAALAGDYRATVQTGDATLTSAANPANVQVVAASGGGFDVQLSYTYAEELTNQTFDVSVSDNEGGSGTGLRSATNASTATFSVADAALSSTAANLTPPTATEGAAFTNALVFHFTDADPAGTASDYLATVQTGDATLTSALNPGNVQVVAHTGGGFDVLLSYTYAEELTGQTFGVSVTDHAATTSQSTATFSVADAALTANRFTPPLATEGAPFSGTVLNFSDADPSGIASDYTALLTLGDGNTVTLTSTSGADGQIVAHGDGTFDVNLSHSYAEELSGQTFGIVVTDHASQTGSSISTFSVADAALTAGALTPPTATEGAAFANTTVFHFTDADPLGTASDYTATVTLGDGNTVTLTSTASASGQIVANGNGFDVQLSYTYAEELTNQTFGLSVSDAGGASTGASTTTFSVSDAALTAGALTPPVATEGSPISNAVLFHFSDADPLGTASDYTATVTWGDGSVDHSNDLVSVVSVVPSAGGFDVVASHTYLEEAAGLTFGVSVTDAVGASTSASTSTFSVSDAALTGSSAATAAGTEGALNSSMLTAATFTDANLGDHSTDFTASINWGDNTTPTVGTVSYNSGTYSVLGTHTYAEEGTYTLGIAVLDAGGQTATLTGTATVADAALTAGTLTPPVATEGAAFSNTTVFHFTDADPNGTASDYSAFVTLADGNTLTLTSTPSVNGQIVASSGGFDVQLSYTYAEEIKAAANASFTVQVTDAGGAPTITATSTPFTVADAALTVTTVTHPASTEGISTGTVTVATFTDAAGTYSDLADLTATITWADGSTSPGMIVAIPGPAGHYSVTASHTYTEEINSAIDFTVSVSDSGGSGNALTIHTATVADAPLTAGTLTPPVATEGAAFANTTVLHFTDAAGASADIADYTATVTLGDGNTVTLTSTPSANGQIIANGNGFDVQLSYTYAEELTNKTFGVSVADAGGASTSASTGTFNVADAALTAGSLTPPIATEGAGFSNVTVFHFTDADPAAVPGDYVATVQTGDATLTSAANPGNVTIVAASGGGFDVQLSYTYAEELTSTIFSVSVIDSEGGSGTGLRSATSASTNTFSVADAALTPSTAANALTATEGAASGTQVVATFTDADPAAAAGDYSGTIHWGDGQSSAFTSADVSLVLATTFNISGSHTYAEEGPYSVTVDINDAGGATTTAANTTFSVADAQLTNLASANLPANGQEGAALAAITSIATFTDPAGVGAETASGDFTATINWGDTTTSAGTVVSLGGGNYQVNAPAHTYAEEGVYSVNVSVTHDALATLTTPDQSITVADAPLTAGALTPAVTTEGTAFSNVTVFHFSDADPAGTANDYLATVQTGDATLTSAANPASVQIVAASGGGFDVQLSYTYAEELSNQTFSVSVTDNSATASASTGTFNVADQQLTGLASANLPANGHEGAPLAAITGLATFTDPAGAEAVGDYTATINWGDTTTSPGTVVYTSGNNFSVDAPSHTYAEEGSYNVTVTLTHDLLAPVTTPTQSIAVADAALTAGALTPPVATEGAAFSNVTVFHFTDADPLGTASDYTALITLGNGNAVTLTSASSANGQILANVNGGFDVQLSYTYAEELTNQTFGVSVSDAGGVSTSASTTTFSVADAALTANSFTPPLATEGAPFSGTVLNFSDSDPSGPASDYTALLTLGDGNTVTLAASAGADGQIVAHGDGTFDVNLSHTYAEELSGQTFGVVVTDHASQASASTNTFSVADAALTAGALTPPVATEGSPITNAVLFHFSDADPNGTASDYTATVTWGDGSVDHSNDLVSVVSVVPSGGGFDVVASHTYLEEAAGLTFGVSVIDNEGGSGTGPRSATSASTNTFSVADAALTSGTTANPLTATEGASSGSWVVATFTDADPAAAAGDYSGTIHWGDGQSSAFTSADVSLVSATTFNISGSHTYSEEGSYSVTVDINDAGGATTTAANTTFSVADAQLTTLATAAMPTGKLEGADIGPISGIATFADPAGVGNETASGDFTDTINWGDNNTSAGTIVSLGNGNYRVDAPAGHTYAEEGTYSVNVTLTHDLLAPVTTPDQSIGIADAPLTAGSLTPPVATEGAPFSNVVIFHFSDADPAGTASDYLATVQTGDATLTSAANPANVKVVPHVGGGFDVTLSYTYAEELSGQTFGVSVSDAGGVSTSASTGTFSVADAALTANSFTPPLATEGASFSGTVLNFSDADPSGTASDYTALLTLGDGNTVTLTGAAGADGQIVAHGDGTFDVNLSHTYAEELSGQTFGVSVSDNAATASASTSTFSVADAALTAGALTPPVATEGAAFANTTVFHFTDADPNGAASDYSALVTRGDGTSVTLTSTAGGNGQIVPHTGGGFDVQMSYTYAEELSGQTFSVVVTDHASTASASTSTFGVIDPAVTVNANSGGTLTAINEATATAANTIVGTFTDSGNPTGTLDSDQTSIKPEYKAVIAWGDGNTTTLDTFNNASAFVSTGGGTFQVMAPAHTYAEEGSYNIALTVTHDALSAVGPTQTATITVADPAVSVTGVAVSATEGLAFTGASVATFTDPAGAEAADGTHYSASINWGDGTAASTGTITLSGGTFTVKGDHTYAEEGSFTVTTTVNHEGVITAATSTATVADAALTAGALTPPVATEGSPITNAVLFHFSDADPLGTASDYTATVTWGDGTVDHSNDLAPVVSIVPSAGGFDVVASHTYLEEAAGMTFSVSVSDSGGASTSASISTFSVADAALTAGALTAPVATEGATFSNTTVFHFTDADPNGTASDYSAFVTLADGNTLTLTSTPSVNGQIVASSGGFDVQLSYTYAEEIKAAANASFTVQVTDAGGAPTITATSTPFTVADAALTVTTVTHPASTEGISTGTVTVATFTDAAGTYSDLADLTATITWADGSTSPGMIVAIPGPAGHYSVTASHTYTEEINSAIDFTVSVSDSGGSGNALTIHTATVADAPLTAGTLTPPVATEGAAFANTTVLHFTDAAGASADIADYTATVTLGDGNTVTLTSTPSANGQIIANGDGYDVQLSYTYAEELTNKTFGVSVADAGGASTGASTSTFNVADAALTGSSAATAGGTEGALNSSVLTAATFTDANPGDHSADFTATINWGDNTTPTVGTVSYNSGTYSVLGTHTYAEEGTYTLGIAVLDAGGQTATLTGTATVADAALTAGTLAPPSASEGAAFSNVVVFHFSDADPAAVAGDYVATVQTGDATLTSAANPGNVQVVANGNGGFDVQLSYTYAEELSGQTFSVSVTDSVATASASTGTFSVADAALTANSFTPPLATEGASFSGTVLNFSDADPSGIASDYTALLTLGDGNTVTLTSTSGADGQIVAHGDGTFDVNLSHTYAEELSGQTFGIVVTDHASQTGSSISTFSVADAALTAGALTPPTATEGSPITNAVLFHFSDADPNRTASDYTATVTWGDGTVDHSNDLVSVVSVVPSGGGFDVVASHTYLEEAAGLTFGVSVSDHTATAAASINTFSVADAALTGSSTATAAGTEGALNSSVLTAATFTDANLGDHSTDFTATINWGDNTTPTVGTVSYNSGTYSVLGTHTYAEEGTYALGIAVLDAGGQTATLTGTATVADAALTAGTLAPPTASEGAAFSNVVVFHFSDADPAAVAGDYLAAVQTGDATLTSAANPGNVHVVAASGGGFDVQLSYTYVEELSNQTFSVSVTDNEGGSETGLRSATSASTNTFSVADQQLSSLATATMPTGKLEGADIGAITGIATFTDPAGAGVEPLGDFTATINWGDTNTSPGTIVSLGGGNYRVDAPTHTYAEEGLYTVNVTLKHDALTALTTPDKTITIADAPLSSTAANLTPPVATEGAAFTNTTVFHFTDADPAAAANDYTALVTLGDGNTLTLTSAASADGQIVASGNGFDVQLSYTYVEELSNQTFGVSVTDNEGGSGTGSRSTTGASTASFSVADAQLTSATANLPANGLEGAALAAFTGIATFTDPAGAEAVSDYTATINWGDATTSPGTVVSLGGGNYRVDAPSHTYTEEGTYSVNVTLKHDALATVTTPTQSISVADAPLSSTAANLTPPVATEGAAFSNVVVFHFTDADPAGTASDYVATVQTGDATLTSAANPANVQVVAHTGGGFDVTLSYTYAEELSNQTFAVSVTDHSATTSQTLSTFSVTDAQLTNLVSANLPANGQEGAALAAISGIATFTDPAGVEAVSDYTATINWGDTTTSTGTVVHTSGNNFRVDAPAHTYVEEGSYNVTVTLKHDALGTLTTPTQNIVIADQQLSSLATATMPTGTVEGAAIGAITGIATFTDPAGAEAVGDYTATINWGDTTTSVGTVVSLGGGNYRVDALTHTYAEEGVYNVNVTLKHDALATVTTPTQGITVADAALTAGTLTPPVATEGAAFSNVTVFHFTDADPAGTASDYSALVTLGDGTSVTLTSTPSAKGQIVAHSGGGFDVQLSYTYVEELSNQTFGVSVTDNEGGSGTGSRSTTGASTASFSVADAQLTSLASANLPASGQEGAALATITGIATFTDPAGAGVEPLGDYTATINWGDTTTSPGTIVSLSGGNYRVDAPAHTYAEEGTFTVNVTLKHDALATLNTPNRTIAIADAPLTAGALTPPLATEGAPFSNTVIFHFSDADPAAVAGDYLATVQTGDATRTSAANPTNVQIVAASGGGFDVKLSYTYAEELSGQTFSVSVTDNEGGSGSGSRSTTGATNNSFSVADAQLTSLAGANLPTTGQEGATVAAITGVATFTDPAGVGSEPLSDFTATINWGDGLTSAGTVVSLSSGNYRVDAPTHIYAGEGTYTVNVTLSHDALSILTTPNQSIAIADAPLTASALALSQTYGADPGSQTVAQFQDTGGAEALNNYSAMINWGDGTAATPGTISYNSGTHTFSVSGDHPYQAAGPFQATTTISHDTAPNAVVISTVTVAKATIAVSVSSSTGTNSAFDQTITFTATVGPIFMTPVSTLPPGGGTPTGQVQFLINGVVVATSTLSGGKATFTTTALQLGQNSITVKYLGDNNFLGGVSATPLMQFSSAGILLLDPTGSNALSVSGNGKVVVNNASIVVDSSSATAISDSGNGSITATLIDDHGGITESGNAQVSGTVLTKQPTVLDPLASLIAPVSSNLIVRSTSTYMITGSQSVVLNPGVYIGGIQISGQAIVTLNPGIYYMQGGGFTVSGNASVTDLGRGVMIYNGAAINSNGSAGAVGQISFSGNCNVLLSAMASGTYQGLSIFQDRTSNSTMSFSGNGSITITGTIYAVKATLTLSGNDILHLGGSSLDLIGAELITADLNVSGNASLIVTALA